MDDGIPIGLILVFVFCLFGSAYFSATEMAFSSVNRIRMRSYADDGDKRAQRVLHVLDQFDSALSTILIGNNVVNIGCATVATVIATNTWGLSAVTIATLITTILVFLLGESIPKAFAKACNESFAMAVSSSVLFLMKALRPLTLLISKITDALSRPLRGKAPQPTVTEEELRDLIEDAVEDGALNQNTGELVQSAIHYTELNVRDILTPWKQVRKLPLATPQEEALKIIQKSSHSRLPVIDDTGEVVGLLRARKYLKATLLGHAPASVTEIMEPVHSIPDTMPAHDLLPMMSSRKAHFTLVRDEWDNILGIVTMEDILERLVGDILDEEDELAALQGGDA